jgi:hypothetical protein
VAQRVDEQTPQNALEIVGCAADGRRAGGARLEPHVSASRLRLEATDARIDETPERNVSQLERQRACVDARVLEEVVDERAERSRLLPQRLDVLLRPCDPVLDRLDHRADRASGVRRSWLAHATSSRRASKSSSSRVAIALKAAPSSAISAGPSSGLWGAKTRCAPREIGDFQAGRFFWHPTRASSAVWSGACSLHEPCHSLATNNRRCRRENKTPPERLSHKPALSGVLSSGEVRTIR